ncbi:DgyrCDS13552 [Dimorphilus gyrociliatus]|uniref:DgyrCDS13552 n=1 Tax=Dimorphilus gyrociliatus TaxID=2664684 RepID=A0A7I8WB02_9ANNE|nr:DgyrCDS13552 [Dimorphilus gyrociliatus]
MNKVLRFFIILWKIAFDLLSDLLAYFKVNLITLNIKTLCSNISKEASSDLLSNDYLIENLNYLFKYNTDRIENPCSSRLFAKIWISGLLEQRARVKNYIMANPSVRKVPLNRPVFIITLIRTGSTFLHCLLENDHRWKCPKLWELEDFAPPPGDKNDQVRIKRCQLKWEFAAAIMGWDEIKRTHNFDPEKPEDFLLLYHMDMKFPIPMNNTMLSKEYTNFIRNRNKKVTKIYDENLKTNLQVLCKNSDMINRRLMGMLHVSSANLETLLETFPDAQIITIHRDSVSLVKSACTLHHLNSKSCHRYFNDDKLGTGMRIMDILNHDSKKLVEWRMNASLYHKEYPRFVDIYFDDLVKQPMETVNYIYQHLGMDMIPEVWQAMSNYLATHKNSKSNPTVLGEYGLSESNIKQTLRTYSEFFKVKDKC